MANALGYVAAGLLGGFGTGISKNAQADMERWNKEADNLRQITLMKLQQEYTTSEREASQDFQSTIQQAGFTHADKSQQAGFTHADKSQQAGFTHADKSQQAGFTHQDESAEAKRLADIAAAEALAKAKLEQIETGKTTKKAKAADFKAGQDVVKSWAIQDYIGKQQGMLSTENPTIEEVLASYTPEEKAKYKRVSELTEGYIKQGESPQKSFALAQQQMVKQEQDKITEEDKKAAKSLDLPVDDYLGLKTMKVDETRVDNIIAKKKENPADFSKLLEKIHIVNPSLYQAVMTKIEKEEKAYSVVNKQPATTLKEVKTSNLPSGGMLNTSDTFNTRLRR